MLNIKLKPCPFCGEKGEIDFSHYGSNVRYIDEDEKIQYTPFLYTVRCTDCGCQIGNYESPNKAIAMWNSRKEANE